MSDLKYFTISPIFLHVLLLISHASFFDSPYFSHPSVATLPGGLFSLGAFLILFCVGVWGFVVVSSGVFRGALGHMAPSGKKIFFAIGENSKHSWPPFV